MIKKLFPIFLLFIFVFILSGCSQQTTATEKKTYNQSKVINSSSDYPMSYAQPIADKLEVYYFHRTARCYSCKTIGQYVRETMEEKYSQQIKNGTIDFRELNVEFPENKEIAQEYEASGSSLFINKIINKEDNIEQDSNVWRLLNNEAKFKSYLENKIDTYLGI
ncbi:MAG: nitrophenyl compound nitroreductase subunit ArsF family protein [Patescibacteria group bacterium]